MHNKPKIYFRADAGPEIGYGHYIRSLALADMLKNDFACTMFTQSPTEYQLREAAGVCEVIALPNDDTRFKKFLDYLTGDEIVVLDNYFFTTDYHYSIKNIGCKLVCIDDMHDKHYVADVIINHCIDDKSKFDIEPYTHLCLGARYALLRAPFLNAQNQTKSIPWVICFGGSDPYNLTYRAIVALQEQGMQHIVAVVGDGYKYREELQQLIGIEVLSGLSAAEMAALLARTKNVICSASTICYEALSQRCKVYAGWYVDNQYEFYKSLLSKEIIVPLGNILSNPIVLNFDKEATLNCGFSFNGDYIRGLFLYLSLLRYNYTELSDSQSYKVWECRNLLEIREYMTNPLPFEYDSHCNFIKKLSLDSSKLYLAWFYGNEFVASFNLIDIKEYDSASRGLFVNPKFQSMKIASHIECYIENVAKNRYNLNTLKAEVLKSNIKSHNYHLRNGYTCVGEDVNYYYYKKQLV